ncbi:MAG: GyrI-like domain-containing protein [Anaerolineaceae bacterium]
MKDSEVTLITLPDVHVISAWAFNPSPENDAWEQLKAFAEPLGLLQPRNKPIIFGFNNPCPSLGSPNYGYEFCLVADPSVKATGDLKAKVLSGGLYARMEFDPSGTDFSVSIPAAWERLNAWVAASSYQQGSHQWLEEHSPQGIPQALLLPIEKTGK